MSFVDLMASDVWSEADISRKMRDMRRASYTDEEWEFICQKMIGALVGMVPEFAAVAYPLSDAEKAEIFAFAGLLRDVQAAGREARADVALLAQVLAIEAGGDPAGAPQPVLDLLAARAAARPAEPAP